MEQSIETEVIFESLDDPGTELAYRYPYEEGEEPSYSKITYKAAKKLKGANLGDRIEVVWDYGSIRCPIVKAKRITGTPETRITELEQRVQKLESLVERLSS